MHINKFNSSYTQSKKLSPMRRSVNLYETHFNKESTNHGVRLPEHSALSGSVSASFSSMNPAASRIESNISGYQTQIPYHGFGSRDSHLDGGASEFMRPSNTKYVDHRMQVGQHQSHSPQRVIDSMPQTATKLFSFMEPDAYCSPLQKKTPPTKSYLNGSAEGLKKTHINSTAMTSKTAATAFSESDHYGCTQPDSEYIKL